LWLDDDEPPIVLMYLVHFKLRILNNKKVKVYGLHVHNFDDKFGFPTLHDLNSVVPFPLS